MASVPKTEKGMKYSKDGPIIPYLMFAMSIDFLIFCEANIIVAGNVSFTNLGQFPKERKMNKNRTFLTSFKSLIHLTLECTSHLEVLMRRNL